MVKPKKYLGQHFLKDENIAGKIVNSMTYFEGYNNVLEIGPGTGVLTKYLLKMSKKNLLVNEIDDESCTYLKKHYPNLKEKIISDDFLKLDLSNVFSRDQFGIIGNFPYNISSQIFFQVLKHKEYIPECVGMIQKEVGQRICSIHGNKTYGILSVLLQTFYDLEYLFDVSPNVFNPPPKVMSGVIRLKRKPNFELGCDEKFLFQVVKQGFQTRRKTLRNALKSLNLPESIKSMDVFNLRAEQLSVQEFAELTKIIEDAV